MKQIIYDTGNYQYFFTEKRNAFLQDLKKIEKKYKFDNDDSILNYYCLLTGSVSKKVNFKVLECPDKLSGLKEDIMSIFHKHFDDVK